MIVVLAIAGLTFAFAGGDDDGDGGPELTAGRQEAAAGTDEPDEPATTTTTTTTSPPIEPADVDAGELLFPLEELAGYVVADPTLAEVDPAEGFCNNPVDASAVEQLESVAYQASDVGPYVVSAIAVFASEDDAIQYTAEVNSTQTCESWVDSDGFDNSVIYVPLDTEASISDGYNQLVSMPDGLLDVDQSVLQEGRVVATIANVSLGANDTDFSDFLTVRQAEILVGRR